MNRRRTTLAVTAAAALTASLLAMPNATAEEGEDGYRPAPTRTPSTSAAQDALHAVAALMNGKRPSRSTGGADSESLTMALRDLAALKGELSGAERQAADRFLARPTDGQNGDQKYQVAEATPVCEGNVCVHYVASTSDAPDMTDADGSGVSDYVELVLKETLHVNDTYVKAGYKEPKPDGNKGGGSQTDIYLQNIGNQGLYGYCTTDDTIKRNPSSTSAYCVLDNDYSSSEFPTNTPIENMKVTAAHEYFHAVQFNYDILEDSWLMENTATWAEDEVYDGVNDNLNYLPDSPLSNPKQSMDAFEGTYQYGNWIWWRYLTERYTAKEGSMPSLVLNVWKKADNSTKGAKNMYSMQALKSVLRAKNADLPKTLAKFGNANRRPGQVYSEGKANNYPKAPLAKRFTIAGNQTRTGTVKQNHLSTSTIRVTPAKVNKKVVGKAKAAPNVLKIQLSMAPKSKGSAAVVSIKMKSGKTKVVNIKINGKGKGTKKITFKPSKVKFAELTLANGGTQYRCWNGGAFSCQGDSKNDNVKQSYKLSGLVNKLGSKATA